MGKQLGPVWSLILGWVGIMFVLALFIQSRDYMGANPILRARIAVREAFQAGSGAAAKVYPLGEETGSLSPSPTGLDVPRQPYNLLNGWLEPRSNPAYPTAERCRAADFQVRLERTGNYRQLTNNYKRGDPDSCSAPIEDMTMAFYKIESIPDYGCLHN